MNGWTNVYLALVKWQWQGKTETFGENLAPVPLSASQISHGTASAVNGGRKATCAMAQLETTGSRQLALGPSSNVDNWKRKFGQDI
jgi:hypothetical protein